MGSTAHETPRPVDDIEALARIVNMVDRDAPAQEPTRATATTPAPAVPLVAAGAPARASRPRALNALWPWLAVAAFVAWFCFGPSLLGVRGGF